MNRLCVIKLHSNKTGQLWDVNGHRILHCSPRKKKIKEKDNDLVMTNMCRINVIYVINILDLLLSYHETSFTILNLVFSDRHSDIPPTL